MTPSIIELIYFLLPLILSGVCNMVYVKLPWVKRWNRPMDNGRCAQDGKRLLGDHKTWQGFSGMIGLTALWLTFFVSLDRRFDWAHSLAVVDYRAWSFPLHALAYGGLWGFGYVLFELPNSYIKRRLNIAPGKNANGFLGKVFLFVDQADSVVGCMLLMLVFYRPAWRTAVMIFVLGVAIHYFINLLLYAVRLKNQAG